MCSEVCPSRTSFSYDLDRDSSRQPHRPMTLDSGPDFEFSFVGPAGLGFESCRQSSADELFADGMILPFFHTTDRCSLPAIALRRPSASLPPLAPDNNSKREAMTMIIPKEDSSGSSPDSEVAKAASRHFWGFKRSASLNNTDKIKGLICSLPLLPRSNSTGSVANPKRALQKQSPSVKMAKSSSFSATSSSLSNSFMSGYSQHHKSNNQKLPPLSRKTSRGSANNGSHKLNNILNVPTPYIIGTANLFGLGSFFCNGKDKKKMRR